MEWAVVIVMVMLAGMGENVELVVMTLVTMGAALMALNPSPSCLPFLERAEHGKTVVGQSPANLCLTAWDQGVVQTLRGVKQCYQRTTERGVVGMAVQGLRTEGVHQSMGSSP